ncbi:TIR domain-containing protein [Nitrogeniibacter mangrovi]|uniref:TIR domain-containing protein n=1 Tax=Nitrogeniibacter mangrovi TaxID=2016596 RepID=A0A6C1B3L7_9RHOO|nr:TIR domain-containing protein [Nitrogeniibacter mangrovi]QID18147.1 TIR domain-containing protein [Nitrogeniibacter mangrovi]
MDGIFISYRRDDSAGYAGRLYDRLVQHFGAERVFMDVEGIEPGTDFVLAIEKAVASCRVLIVLIGDEWLNVADTSGRRRLDDPHDFIRLETSTALARDIRVVPVLLDGTPMPPMDALPEDLQPLVRRQAVELTHKQWEATSGELIRTLEKILQTPADMAETAPANEAPVAAPPSPPRRRWLPAWAALGALVLGVGAWTLTSVRLETPETRVTVSRTPAPPAASAPADASPSPPESSPVEPTPAPARLAATDTRLAFGPLATGSAQVREWSLRNDGGQDAPVTLELGGKDAASFRIPVQTCTAGIAAGARCSVSIQYRPANPGTHEATLSAVSGANRIVLALSGSAEAPPPRPPPEPATPAAPRPPKPEILALEATPEAGGARLCYRVKDADTVVLEPQGGRMANASRDCTRVTLDAPATITLIASNGIGTVSRRLRVEPGASTPATPTTTASSLLPAPGDTWVYRMRGKWANSPKRTLSITVDKVDGGLVTETMTLLEPRQRPGGTHRSSNAAPAFVDWTWMGWEFTPWFITSEAIREGRWSGFKVPDMDNQWFDWRAEAKVSGREDVSVPAGRFSAITVQVLAQRRQTGSQIQADVEPTQAKFTLWYAPQAKRYVKMERIIQSASGIEIERDRIELVRYTTH